MQSVRNQCVSVSRRVLSSHLWKTTPKCRTFASSATSTATRKSGLSVSPELLNELDAMGIDRRALQPIRIDTLIRPEPFQRFEHLLRPKMEAEQQRVRHLPMPRPLRGQIPVVNCVMHHLISHGPSTLDGIWQTVRMTGIVRSKQKLRGQFRRWFAKHGSDGMPFINLAGHKDLSSLDEEDDHGGWQNDILSDDSGMESDYGSGQSGFSSAGEADSSLPRRVPVYDIRPGNRDVLIEKYQDKWQVSEEQLNKYMRRNRDKWWYLISEQRKPKPKGPLIWDQIVSRLRTDSKVKHALDSNRITSATLVMSYGLTNGEWIPIDKAATLMRNQRRS